MHQEEITLVNTYAPNQGAPKYVKQLLTKLKGETDQNYHSRGPKYPTVRYGQIVQTENH